MKDREHVMYRAPRLFWLVATAALLAGGSVALASDAADAEKEIKKLQSAIKRHVVTAPRKAEKEWLEAKGLIDALEQSNPDHEQLPHLQKKHATLKKALEKRLHRQIGQAEGQTEKPESKKEQSATSSDPPSGDKPALSRTVLSYLQKINKALDAVESGIEKFRLQTAKRKITDAKKDMDLMMKRHGRKIPDGNAQVEATKKRLETVSAAFDKAQAAAEARAEAEAQQKKTRETQSKKWVEKMRPFFTYDNPLYLRSGSDFNGGTEEEKVEYRKAYAKAEELMTEYENTEFPCGKTYELASQEMRLSQKLLDYNEDQKRGERDAACKKWIDAFRAFVSAGSGEDKFLVRSPKFGKDHINRQAELLEEAQTVWSEYQKVEFSLGKNLTLVNLEKEMAAALEEMPEVIRQSRALVSGRIEQEFDQVLAALEQDNGWKTDKTKMPRVAMKRDIEPLSRALEEYAATVEPDDPKLAAIQKKLELIHAKDRENRAICAQRRYMRPWKYAGSDNEDVEEAAQTIVLKEFKDAEILRTTLPATEWEEERVLEFTDTTQTAVRYRVTRYMTADVAAKAKDGKVYLHCVHVAADRTSSGGWGQLYGNVKWSDWIIEENVNKNPPTP